MIFNKKLTTLGLLLAISIPLVGCSSTSNRIDVSKMDKLTENVYVELSEDWEHQGQVLGYETWSINGEASLNIVTESMQGYSSKEYLEASINSVVSVFELDEEEIEKDSVEFDNYKAETVRYENNLFGTTTDTLQFLVCEDDTAYIFTVSSSDEISDSVIKSVEEVLETLVIQAEEE